MTLPRSPLRGKDVAEIAIRSLMLAAPLAVTEEVWSLGGELSLGRIVMIALTSFLVIGAFIYTSFKNDGVIPNGRDFYILREYDLLRHSPYVCRHAFGHRSARVVRGPGARTKAHGVDRVSREFRGDGGGQYRIDG